MIVNNNFYGIINGKRMSDFTRDMNYSIATVQERIEYVEERLNHNFFEEVFTQSFDAKLNRDGVYWVEQEGSFLNSTQLEKWCNSNGIDIVDYLDLTTPFDDIDTDSTNKGFWNYSNNNTSKVKLVLNSSDSQYTDSNICKEITKLADYILAKDSKKLRDEYVFFTDEELFKRSLREQDAVNTIKGESNNDSDALLFLRRKGQNYKKEKKQKIYTTDISNHSVISDYHKSLEEYRDKMREIALLEKQKKEQTLDITREEYNKKQRHKHIIKKNIALTKDDMIQAKDSLNGTIYFKSASIVSDTTPNWSNIDFFDKDHIRALLQLGVRDITTDIGAITHDLENIIKSINLREREAVSLDLWRKGYTLEVIGNEIGVTNQAVDKILNMICKKVIREYELIYAKHYYLNTVKTDYQRCSCCETYLPKKYLFFHYDSTNKRYRSKCKKCVSRK